MTTKPTTEVINALAEAGAIMFAPNNIWKAAELTIFRLEKRGFTIIRVEPAMTEASAMELAKKYRGTSMTTPETHHLTFDEFHSSPRAVQRYIDYIHLRLKTNLEIIAEQQAEVERMRRLLLPYKGRREAFADSILGLDAPIAVDEALNPEQKGGV